MDADSRAALRPRCAARRPPQRLRHLRAKAVEEAVVGVGALAARQPASLAAAGVDPEEREVGLDCEFVV